MDLLLNEQQALLADTVARLCREYGGPKRARALRDARNAFDGDAWRAIVDAGWLGTAVAESRGGLGLGFFDLALALEAAGRQMLMVPLTEAAAAAAALSALGDGTAPLLAQLLEGRLILPATSAPQWGPAAPLGYDDKAGTLTGSIPFVPFAATADAFLVATDAVVCVVESSALRIDTHVNVDGSSAGTLTFAESRVAADQILARGAVATATARRLRECLALGASAELAGLAAGAHDITIDYIKLRQQFGKPIGSFQALQHRAADNFIAIELNRSLVYRVLAAFDAGEHHPAMVAAAKARCSRTAFQIVREALQMHGAIGYTDEHDIGLYYKRAIALAARYGGDLAHTGHFSELTRA